MNITPESKTIRALLGSKHQFLIPRFQREYSWDKKNYQEFLDDMLGNLTCSKQGISPNQYFLGTMLFIGNFTEGTEQEIQVVDGQQRLTTITILFSAMAARFKELGQETFSEKIFDYIMTKDDNGESVRILKSKSNYPFFAYYIQDREKKHAQEPETEEERCIKQTYEYFKSRLTEEKLKQFLKQKQATEAVEMLSETDILKALRDQVLNSIFVSLSTTDKDQANRIFEILNAKGKRLADIDLIKNKIFELLDKEEPADYAEESWKEIRDILNSREEPVGFATFYRHYWISKYKKTYSNKLYDDFTSSKYGIKKTEAAYTDFLKDMKTNAATYMKIVNPQRSDYGDRKEYFWLVQSLHVLNDYFNVVQVRIALLALFDVKKRDIIDMKLLKIAVQTIENFHFVYNALLSMRSNRLEKIYSDFAINLRKAKNKGEARAVIQTKLFDPLNALFPDYSSYRKKFVSLTFSKKDSPANMKTKYVINKLNCYFGGKEIFEDDGSVEHIVPESDGKESLNIGNLILLEGDLNRTADQDSYMAKKAVYQKSNYKWVAQFCGEHADWNVSMIENRASELADIYYEKILGRKPKTIKS